MPNLTIALTKDTSAYRCYVPKSHDGCGARATVMAGGAVFFKLQAAHRSKFERAQAHKRGIFIIVSFLEKSIPR